MPAVQQVDLEPGAELAWMMPTFLGFVQEWMRPGNKIGNSKTVKMSKTQETRKIRQRAASLQVA